MTISTALTCPGTCAFLGAPSNQPHPTTRGGHLSCTRIADSESAGLLQEARQPSVPWPEPIDLPGFDPNARRRREDAYDDPLLERPKS
jgi:hypothetical protein